MYTYQVNSLRMANSTGGWAMNKKVAEALLFSRFLNNKKA